MRKSSMTLVVLAIMTLSSCKPILYTVYGIKKPDYMPVQKVQRQAWKLGIDTSGMRYIRPEQYAVALTRIKTLPNAYIFNAKGQMIVWQTGEEDCKGTLAEFLQGLKPNMQFETDSLSIESVYSELEAFRTPSAQSLKPTPSPDYRVVIYWGTFLGKLNRDYLPEWIDACRNNQHCRIKPLLVNYQCSMAQDDPPLMAINIANSVVNVLYSQNKKSIRQWHQIVEHIVEINIIVFGQYEVAAKGNEELEFWFKYNKK